MDWTGYQLKSLKAPKKIHACQIKPFDSVSCISITRLKKEIFANLMSNGLSHHINGSGSRDDPYEYPCAADISPHFMICYLWARFRLTSDRIYIRVNDWKFKLTLDGVIAEDGVFTKLITDAEQE